MADASRAPFGGKRILVAQDDALLAALLASDLKELGFAAVDVVRTLDGALQSARSFHPDVLLLDLHLMGGHVTTVSTFVGIPLVLMSDDPVSAAVPGLAAPVVSKPFTPVALEEALVRVVLAVLRG